MTYVTILGSGREVGRSALLIEDRKKIILDYGVKIQPEPPTYPPKEKADAAIISHAHLDHIGATPILAHKSDMPIFMNDVTMELGAMLISDSMKVARKEGFGIPFDKHDVKRAVKNTKIVCYNERFKVGEFACSLHDAGHIPGSSSILLDNGKKILYTSDIQTRSTHLLDGCRLPGKVDTLIIESTYGMRVQEDRKKEEKRLRHTVDETIGNGGIVLIPVLAVGRAQEVMLILQDHAKKIALDGMAKISSEIIAEYSHYIKNPKDFKELLRKIKFVRTDKDREEALKKYPIIISPAGMLSGGHAVRYLREIQEHKGSSIIFTSFLAEESPGFMLTQTGIFENEEERFNVHGSIHQIELSAHADRNGLLEIIEKTKPETVICVHGDNCPDFAKSISELGINAFAPRDGEKIRV